jgi:hypothetical protein
VSVNGNRTWGNARCPGGGAELQAEVLVASNKMGLVTLKEALSYTEDKFRD